jgi:hypothetical protein
MNVLAEPHSISPTLHYSALFKLPGEFSSEHHACGSSCVNLLSLGGVAPDIGARPFTPPR